MGEILKGIRGRNLFCSLGHELVVKLDRELQLGDCVLKLFSKERDECRECGVCSAFLDTQGKTAEEVGDIASILQVQRKVLHPKVVRQHIYAD